MLKRFSKVIYTMMLAVALTGCASYLTAPITFGPQVFFASYILWAAGEAGNNAIAAWHIFTWITYVQLVSMCLMIVFSGYLGDDPRQKKFKTKTPNYSKTTALGITIIPCFILVGVTYLYFPALRGADLYPGAGLQLIPAGLALLLGIFFWIVALRGM